MARQWSLLLLCLMVAALFLSTVHGSLGVRNLLHHRDTTTTEPPPVVTTPNYAAVYTVNNVPNAAGCTVHFDCKKKLKEADSPKPCLKYCVNRINCANNVTHKGKPDECLHLNEELVAQEYRDSRRNGDTVNIMRVAMIDFPCQPGYLPDSRGRCREVW